MQKKDNKYLISVAPLTRITLTRDQSFFYVYESELSVGTLVEVPIGRRHVEGIVTNCTVDFPRESNFQLKKLSKILEKDFLTTQQLSLAEFISSYYLSPLGVVLKYFIPKRVQMRGTIVHKKVKQKNIIIDKMQNKIINKLTKSNKKYFLHVTNPTNKAVVLFSFMQKIIADNENAQILYLFPELMQTPYFKAFIYHFFPADDIVFLHSKLGKGEFYKNWRDIKSGKAKIIIGTRSALFAPFKNLGAIVVDEAHDMSHKQWDHNPLFDARTTSLNLANIFNCLHLLVSATPRAVDYYKTTKNSDTEFISYTDGNRPTIKVIDMKKERWDKNKSPLSRELINKIRYALKDKKQTLLFVNRQGSSAFSICSKCRSVAKCPHCSRALINTKQKIYKCNHCNYTIKTYAKCIKCKAPMEHIGIGTQKIQKELNKIFPKARIVIVDGSTMKKTGAHNKLYRDFSENKIDIVIGTQMITKGWNSNNIALSAIIDMEHLLCLPEYDVNEKAFAFIIQMALRAGNGQMIVQTFQPEDSTIQYATKYDFEGFFENELSLRKILSYPPHTKLIKLLYQDTTKKNVEQKSKKLYDKLQKLYKNDNNLIISEPHSPLIDKIRTKYRKQIIIKNKNKNLPNELRIILTSLNIKWTVDIDPVTTI